MENSRRYCTTNKAKQINHGMGSNDWSKQPRFQHFANGSLGLDTGDVHGGKGSHSRILKEWANIQGLENLSLDHEIEQRAQQYRVQTEALVPKVGYYSQGFWVVCWWFSDDIFFIPSRAWPLGLVTSLNTFIWTRTAMTVAKTEFCPSRRSLADERPSRFYHPQLGWWFEFPAVGQGLFIF